MTDPLALVCYERLLPGSQLVNRLQDLGYRVHALADVDALAVCAAEQKPLVVLVDLHREHADIGAAIARLRQDPRTAHLPVIAFAGERETGLQAAAQAAGATVVVSETRLLAHLGALLDQALQVE
jgi:CheY-like chemotaxis protein